jgi:hypothetical protein
MKLFSLTVAAVVLFSPSALAESVTVRCPLLRQVSEMQVNFLVHRASAAIGEQEAARIYAKYESLKAECAVNAAASRTLSVSGRLKDWLNQNGLDLYRIASKD